MIKNHIELIIVENEQKLYTIIIIVLYLTQLLHISLICFNPLINLEPAGVCFEK